MYAYIKSYKILRDESVKRCSGLTTLKSLYTLSKTKDYTQFDYSSKMGGNGAAMRSSPIGLLYNKSTDINKLIELSIECGRMTHNYILGYMGSFVNALFTSYAVNSIAPWKWVKNLITLLHGHIIDDYLKTTYGYDDYIKQKYKYISKWEQYNEEVIEKLMNDHNLPSVSKKRWEYIVNNYSDQVFTSGKNSKDYRYGRMGQSGLDVLIIALDGLLMSLVVIPNKKFDKNNPNSYTWSWDSFLYFTTLHFGDNDTTGAIAGGWYGALNGFKNVTSKYKDLEYYDKLVEAANSINSILQN
jgi:ADP-ribosylarginine hydrolase